MRFLPAGHHGLLVECDDLAQVMALHRALVRSRPTGVVDLVPAAQTLLVTFDESTAHDRLAAMLANTDLEHTGEETPGAAVTIEVTYDGADLADVAELTGIPVDEVVRRHQAAGHVVAFTGFAPGFAYIAGGDPALEVPRRSTPRTRVPGRVGCPGRRVHRRLPA
jgi:allophanate hydrolase subunit 1